MVAFYFRFLALFFIISVFQANAMATKSASPPSGTRLVLVLYKLNPPSRYNPNFEKSRADHQRALMARTKHLEDLVLGSLISEPKTLWLVNGSIAQVTSEEKIRIEAHPEVAEVIDMGARILLDPSLETKAQSTLKFTYGLERLRIPELWSAKPNAVGRGIRVAVLDTGIDASHPDLRGKVRAFKDFTSERNDTIRDDHGHGTHVAGTIAGGQTSGRAIGVAPGVELIIAKGFTRSGATVDTWMLEAMQWIADPDGNPETEDQAEIASNSWGTKINYSNLNPSEVYFCRAVLEWRSLGILPVFSTGNEGPSSSTVLIPAACPEAVSVGGTDFDDAIMRMSSRGPVRWKSFQMTKPEITAPGSSVTSAAPGGGYRSRSGTSMAAPHIAGAFAILRELAPEAHWSDLEKALYRGADDLGTRGQDNLFGHGRANLLRTVERL